MTIPEASPIEEQGPKRRLNGGKKALFILAAGCGGTLVLLLATCGISVAVGMFQAMLPPQIEITYRGRTSGLDQLAASYGVPQGPANTAKNTSRKPLRDVVVDATWHLPSGTAVASAKAILRGSLASGEERMFDLKAQIDQSKLTSTLSPTSLYTPEQWDSMSRSERETAILRIAKMNRAVGQANDINLDEAFSKPPTIKVTSASGEEIRSKLIDRSK